MCVCFVFASLTVNRLHSRQCVRNTAQESLLPLLMMVVFHMIFLMNSVFTEARFPIIPI